MQDDQAWNYFERAIALRPGDNEEAVNRYTEHLLAQGQASRAVQALERLTTPEQRRSSFVQALLHKRAADRAGLHSQEIDMESASVLQRFTTEPLGGYSAESFLSSSSVDTVNSNDNLASEFATVTQAATSDDSSTLFAWLSNGAIGEGELSSDNSIGTMYSFPAPPSGGVMKLVTLRLPDSGSLTDRAGLFAIGTNNIVYYRYLDGSSWGSWQSLGVSAVDLSAVVWPNGQADVFRVDTDRCNVYVSHSTDGQTWGGWNWWGACGDQIAVAVLPDSTAWAMLRTHFPAPYNLDVVVNRYFNGTSWANQWSLFPGALYGVNNMALQAHPTPLLGSIRMTFYTVDANNTTVYARVSNGPAWSDQVFWTSGFKQVSSFDTLDGGFYLLFIGTSDSQLYTERFDGSAWSGIIPQDMFWLAGTGGKYKDRHIRPKGVARAHTNVNDDCRNFASQLTCQPDPVLGGCFHPWALNLAEILFNEARFEKSGAQAMVGWTVRDRAFLSLKKVLANGSTCTSGQGCLRCDSYHGAEAGLLTGSCRAALTRKPSCT